MFLGNGREWSQIVQYLLQRFGLAVGARKMIDSEYDHAVESLTSGLYVWHTLLRLLIGINRRNQNVPDLENTQNVSVVTFYLITMKLFSEKSLILHAKIALVNDLCLFQQDLNSVVCIGL